MKKLNKIADFDTYVKILTLLNNLQDEGKACVVTDYTGYVNSCGILIYPYVWDTNIAPGFRHYFYLHSSHQIETALFSIRNYIEDFPTREEFEAKHTEKLKSEGQK